MNLVERLIGVTLAWAIMAITGYAPADTITDKLGQRLDAVESRLAAIESVVLPPATQPTPVEPKIVRADTLNAVRAAIESGATLVQTAGIELSDELDARGATIELLPGGPGWKPAVTLTGSAVLRNATLKTPPSTYNAAGQRTGFRKAVESRGPSVVLREVTFADDTGFCIHLMSGRLTMDRVRATTFSEYFIYQEAGTAASATSCEVVGGSRAESLWRTSGGTYRIEDCILDNSAGGKAVLRGDSPSLPDGSPGGVVRRSRLVGNVGPNPLTEDDGGQMLGIDRWRFAEGWIYQLDYTRKAEAIAFAQAQRARGLTAFEIVRATADRFIDGAQLAKVAKGKTKLTDADLRLTLELRAKEVGRSSTYLIEDCEIVGDLRINARATGVIKRTTIAASGSAPFAGNSQPTYPWPIDRTIVAGESAPPPSVLFDMVTITGGPHIGIDLKAFPGLRFNQSTYKGAALQAVSR